MALAELAGDDRLVRLPSFLAAALLFVVGVLSLPAGRARIYGALLLGSSTLLNLYAAEARAYALLALLVFSLFLLALRMEETPLRTVATAVLAAAALYTHYLALFAVGALTLFAILRRRRRSALALAAGGALFLPWVPVLLKQPEGSLAWMRESSLRAALGFLSALGGVGRIPPPFTASPFSPTPLLLLAAAAGTVLLAFLLAASRKDVVTREAVGLVLLVLGGALAVSIWRNLAFAGRTEMAVLPVWLWAVARRAPELPGLRRAAFVAIALGLIATVLAMGWPGRSGVVEIPRTLVESVRPGDQLFAGPPLYLAARLARDRGEIPVDPRGIPEEIERHPGWSRLEPFTDEELRPLARAMTDAREGDRIFLLFWEPYRRPALERLLASRGTVRGSTVSGSGGVFMLWTPRAPPSAPR